MVTTVIIVSWANYRWFDVRHCETLEYVLYSACDFLSVDWASRSCFIASLIQANVLVICYLLSDFKINGAAHFSNVLGRQEGWTLCAWLNGGSQSRDLGLNMLSFPPKQSPTVCGYSTQTLHTLVISLCWKFINKLIKSARHGPKHPRWQLQRHTAVIHLSRIHCVSFGDDDSDDHQLQHKTMPLKGNAGLLLFSHYQQIPGKDKKQQYSAFVCLYIFQLPRPVCGP